MTEAHQYDLAVIGSGPGGEAAAMQASKLKKSVVMIEKLDYVGGASLHTGSVPSKSLRETVVHLEVLRRRVQKLNLAFDSNTKVDELMARKETVIQDQESSFRRNIHKTGIRLIHGTPIFKTPSLKSSKSFKGPHILDVETEEGVLQIKAKNVIIATGSSPFHPPWAQIDGEHVFDSDTILHLKYLPKKLTVIGAGVIGCEYACIFAKLGIRVNLISADYNILGFLDHEITDRLKERMREQRIVLRFGEEVQKIDKLDDGKVVLHLKSGKELSCSHVLLATGRNANSDHLGLEKLGVKIGRRGRLEVDPKTYQTNIPRVYGVGDVTGFPGLSSTAMLQGRIATLHAFNQLKNETLPENVPFGIWTIPSVSMVGKTERELTESCTPYEIGIAYFKEVVRSRILGEDQGILKLLFCPKTLKLLGVHIIGPRATELIHLGHTVMHFGGDIKFFTNTVFNFPTLDEAYRIAAFNGINRLTHDL